VSVDTQGNVADFAAAPDDWPMLALKIDERRQLLWATEVAMNGFDRVEKSAQGRSALLCFDLRSAELLRRIEGPRPSALGDIALTQKRGRYRVRWRSRRDLSAKTCEQPI
jgi:hypothetical protein